MGVQEVVLLTLAGQLTQATGAFCTRAGPICGSPTGAAAYAVGAELCANLGTLIKWGLQAAQAEFSATNTAEKTFCGYVQSPGLPPIT